MDFQQKKIERWRDQYYITQYISYELVRSFQALFFLAQDGVLIKGLFLEGAGWDKRNAYLVEAEPMQLVCPLPTVHFKPVENKKKSGKGNGKLIVPPSECLNCFR